MFKDEIREAVGPTQYGTARPRGPVALQHEPWVDYALDPNQGLIAVDVATMYNEMDMHNIGPDCSSSSSLLGFGAKLDQIAACTCLPR
jgi:hypothetical protein